MTGLLRFTILICFSLVFTGVKPTSAQDTWEELSVPFMATVNQMVVSPNGSVFTVAWKPYVGSMVYRSVDQGANWSALDLPPAYYRLAVNGDGMLFGVTSTTIMRSADNGDNWEVVGTGPSMFSTIAVSPAGVVAAGNIDWQGPFILLSYDDGTTWDSVPVPGYMEQMYLYFNNAEDLFMANENDLRRSADYGATWSYITPPGYFGQPSHSDLAFGENGEIYYGMSWDNGIYRSEDNGDTWQRVLNTGMEAIAVNSSNEVFAGHYRSADGITWTLMDGFEDTGISEIVISNEDIIYVATDYGISISSDNGQTWYQSQRGLADAEITGLKSVGEHVFMVKNGKIFRSDDNGLTWQKCYMPDENYSMETLNVSPSGDVFAFGNYSNWVGEYDVAVFSEDMGITWNSYTLREVSDIAPGTGGNMFMLSQTDLYRSWDDGLNWEMVTTVPECFNPLEAVTDAAGTLYVNSPLCNDPVVYVSTDNGNTWLTGNLPEGAGADRLYVDTQGDVFALKVGVGICRSSDMGNTWQQLVTMPYFEGVNVMEIDPNGRLYASSGADVIVSDDSGNTWTAAGEGLAAGEEIAYLGASETGFVYASTAGGKMFRRHFTTGADNAPLAGLSLYPNPARDIVNVVSTPASAVRGEQVMITDITGKTVKTFIMETGHATLDVSSLDAGMYLVTTLYGTMKLVKVTRD